MRVADLYYQWSVTTCGLDWNKQNATAEACGTDVYDEDYAYVNVPEKPDLVVAKNVTIEDGKFVVNS